MVLGQTYRFKNYTSRDKLPDQFNTIYTINQDNNGFLFAGTGSGLVKFDGFVFHPVVFPDSVLNRTASVTLKDKTGKLWFGCDDGTLFYSENDKLIRVPDLDIQIIRVLLESPDGFIWLFPQDGAILRINENNPSEIVRISIPGNITISSACLLPDGRFLLGIGMQETLVYNSNLLYCSILKDSLKIESIVSGTENSNVQSIQPLSEAGKYIVGVDGEGLYRLKITNDLPALSRFPGHKELESVKIKSTFIDKAGSVWISTRDDGVMKIELSSNGEDIESQTVYNTTSGLAGKEVNTVFQDMEQNIWIGFMGEGLSLFSSGAFSFYSPFNDPERKNIIYINEFSNKYLLGTPKGYSLFNIKTGKSEPFIDLSQYMQRNEILTYYLDNRNRLWIGTKGGGLFMKDMTGGVTKFYSSGNNSEDEIRHITSDGKNLWLSTIDGVIVIDENTGLVIKKYKSPELPPAAGGINQVFIEKDGAALLALQCDRLYDIRLEKGVSTGNGIMSGSIRRNKVNCFTESTPGEIWAATAGNGVFYIVNDSVQLLTTENGLQSNYCRSILADTDKKVWICHERGFSRYDINTGIMKVFSNDFAKGADCNPMAIFETTDGKILIGTTEGLIYYDRTKDKKNSVAPINNILSVTINQDRLAYQSSYTLPYRKVYKIKIEYVGINLTDPEKVTYQTKLDPIEDKWSEFNYSREITYTPLSDGRYRFNLKSYSGDGLTMENSATFEMIVKKPVWRTWWFILVVIALVSGIVVVIIYFREKSQKEINEYLESELAERTRLVLKQKDEIELQNIEITDSINYAKRIQSSILPDVNKLRESFKDAFIIFHPRDIVSGDFYWFDKIDEEKFVIVCADSTGHGVPGAFMSMIGSTLLQDIVSRKKITKPSEVLTLLDRQIFTTLNQNIEIGVSNDGMDMVVCEFNVKTRHIRFASAMRPVIILIGGESYYIRGNRCSVGGESVVEKFFDDQEYYLTQGDTVYLFSDGLPDQFGGADGKKMKIARLKKLIEEVSKLPMAEQKEIISNFYFDWKGDFEQVDDILLMGVKV
jgi:ligand-binding sensor domain-containing protein/serine phosphatase RsbU (regulator of sigma subunit)